MIPEFWPDIRQEKHRKQWRNQFYKRSLSMLPFFDAAHAVNLLRGIHELRAERKFFDVTLCAEGKEFHCHRTVLAAASTYFRAMFAGTLRESVMDRVVLHEVSAELLGLLVDFCYTGRVTVTHDNVDLLLKTADLFQFPIRQRSVLCIPGAETWSFQLLGNPGLCRGLRLSWTSS